MSTSFQLAVGNSSPFTSTSKPRVIPYRGHNLRYSLNVCGLASQCNCPPVARSFGPLEHLQERGSLCPAHLAVCTCVAFPEVREKKRITPHTPQGPIRACKYN